MKYDYMENLKEDIKEYIRNNKEYLEGKSQEELYDIMFLEDSITGNALNDVLDEIEWECE